MKLLFVGSLLVLVSVVALAAAEWRAYQEAIAPEPPRPPDPVIARIDPAADRSSRKTILWQTSTGPEDCDELHDRRKSVTARDLAELIRTSDTPQIRDEDPCLLLQLGRIDPGTEVEILDGYGSLTKIRLLSGTLRDREAYVDARMLVRAEGTLRPRS